MGLGIFPPPPTAKPLQGGVIAGPDCPSAFPGRSPGTRKRSRVVQCHTHTHRATKPPRENAGLRRAAGRHGGTHRRPHQFPGTLQAANNPDPGKNQHNTDNTSRRVSQQRRESPGGPSGCRTCLQHTRGSGNAAALHLLSTGEGRKPAGGRLDAGGKLRQCNSEPREVTSDMCTPKLAG